MIRKATVNDLDEVWSLYQKITLDVKRVDDPDYAATVQKDGFIVSESNKEDLEQRITSSQIFNVFEDKGINGFIDVNREIYFPEEADNIIWLDDKLKNEYFHGDSTMTLHLINVDEEIRGQGIAAILFEDALNTLRNGKYKHLFSIVTTGPLTNCPSLIWHTKMGFQRVCVTDPIDLFGLKNYTSLLFYKNL